MISLFLPINKVRECKGGEIMRVGSINQVSQLYQASSTTKKKNVSFESQLDAVSISSVGKEYQTAKNALLKVSDVRQDKVDALKQSIQSGSYEVSTEDFAAHLMAAFKNRTI